jgi:flagellar hook-associated protein 2
MGTTLGTSGIDWSTVGSTTNSNGTTAGFDVSTIVNEVIQSERQQETQWQSQETTFKNQATALQQLGTQLQSLLTSVNALNDPLGSLSAMTATVSDPSAVSATAGSGATLGSHSISVTSLATTSSFYSNELATSSTTFGTGTITLQVGSGTATPITVDSTNNTLAGLAAAINSKNLGLTANVISDVGGARLSLVSNSSGTAGNITISSNTTGLSFNLGSQGADAALTVDGVPIDSSSNTITTAIPGVTLNLLSQTSSPVTLQVGSDTSQVVSAINSFVSAYNTVISNLNSQFTYNAGTQAAGTLMGDSSAEIVQSTLLADIATSVSGNGAITSLASLGISMGEDGTLTVDNSQLTGALAGNFQAAQTFFQTASTGFAAKFASDLTTLTDPAKSPIVIDVNGINSSVSSLQSQIADFEANLLTEKQSLMTYYSKLNTTLQSLPTLLNSVNDQLGSLKTS